MTGCATICGFEPPARGRACQAERGLARLPVRTLDWTRGDAVEARRHRGRRYVHRPCRDRTGWHQRDQGAKRAPRTGRGRLQCPSRQRHRHRLDRRTSRTAPPLRPTPCSSARAFRTAFVTTKGFRDILALQRHGRSRIYDLEYQKPQPVVARSASFEVAERILADGTIDTPLDASRCRGAPRAGAAGPVPTRRSPSAFSMPLSNPAHEVALRELLSEGPAGPARHDFLRHHARIPRIRARIDDDAFRLCAACDRAIHRPLPHASGSRGVSRSLLGDAVEWGPAAGGGDARQCHQCPAFRPRRGRGGGRAPGRPLGLP